MTISIGEAIDILAVLGSASDPVFHKRVETDAVSLGSQLSPTGLGNPKKVRIWFYRCGVLHKGSLADMVMDRMGLKTKTTRVSRHEIAKSLS